MKIIEKFVPIMITSGNKLSGNWYIKHNYTKKIYKDLGWYFPDIESPHVPKGTHVAVEITVILGKGAKRLDEDNMQWGLKPIFDFLKHRGFIYEDSPKWITRKYDCVRAIDIKMHPEDYGINIKILYDDEVG